MDWNCGHCGTTLVRATTEDLKEAVKDHICDDDEHRRWAAADFRRTYSGSGCQGQNCRHVIRGLDSADGDSGFECVECGHDHCRWYVGYAFRLGKSDFGSD